MTSMSPVKNVGASVRARLKRRAIERKGNVQLLFTRYAIERLLYRLGVSTYSEQFVLKGAMLFSLWAPVPYRQRPMLTCLDSETMPGSELLRCFGESAFSALQMTALSLNPRHCGPK